MAHLLRLPVYLIVLLLGLSAFTSGHRGYRPDPTLSPARQRLMAVAHAHVGVCEATGHDDGPQVEAYQRVTGNRRGDAWCSSHCAACFVEAGLPLPRGVSGAAKSWFPRPALLYENGQWLRPGVSGLPGDLLGYVYRGNPLIHHVGLEASAWGPTAMVYAIEGNYGGCVKIVLRPKRTVHAVARHLPA